VALAFAGVPVGTLIVVPLVLACPLMMLFMMRGMGHGASHQDEDDHGAAPAPPEQRGRRSDGPGGGRR
jgi:hypothetical protein